MKPIWFGLILLFLLSLLACREPAAEDVAAPVIEIHQPEDAATFQRGDTILISATISENDQLHLVSFRVIDLKTGLQAWEALFHYHDVAADFSETFVPEVTDSTSYQLRVIALDHHGNEAMDIRHFFIQ
ncbi:MAG: hypothetical protein D6722_22995 [Bacteroidetes bacterium]|nr:MAG: hypothetical protein D6722_22995 [Bacteroidota bacterium]